MKAYCEQLLAQAAASPSGLVVTLEGRDALKRAKAIRRACYSVRKDRSIMIKLKIESLAIGRVEIHITRVQ